MKTRSLLFIWGVLVLLVSGQQVTEFALYRPGSPQNLQDQSAIQELFIRNIRNNTVINLAFIPEFTIEAQCSKETSRCLFFVQDQSNQASVLNRTENFSPFFLGGDERPPNTTLFSVSLSVGNYLMAVIPLDINNKTGVISTFAFSVIDDTTIFTDPTFEPQPTDFPTPSPTPLVQTPARAPLTNDARLGFYIFVAIGVVAFVLMIVAFIVGYIYLRRKKARQPQIKISDIALVEYDPRSHDLQVALASKIPPHLIINFDDISTIEDIGKGNFGVVYRGIWKGKQVAVKKILKFPKGIEEKMPFEALLMLKLPPHKNVSRILGVVTNPVCLVTKFYEGGTVKNILDSNQLITPKIFISWCLQISMGMKFLHNSGIVHRDLAARNLLLSKKGTLKISDLGMSRMVSGLEEKETQTAEGAIKWMSPEDLIYCKYSLKSDVWSFGITLVEFFSRADPWPNKNKLQVGMILSEKKLDDLIPENFSPKLKNLIEKCLDFNPETRPDFSALERIFSEISGDAKKSVEFCNTGGNQLSRTPTVYKLGAEPNEYLLTP